MGFDCRGIIEMEEMTIFWNFVLIVMKSSPCGSRIFVHTWDYLNLDYR